MTESSSEEGGIAIEELRRLVVRFERALEDERSRFARFLHDDVSQALTVVRMNVEALRKGEGEGTGGAYDASLLDEIDAAVQTAARASRRMIGELRPALLDQFGLAAALEGQAEDLTRRTGVAFRVVDETNGRELPARAGIILYRIFEEAAANVVRHARARGAVVRLAADERQVELTVTDDGAGIDPHAARGAGVGLLAARERARAEGGAVELRRLAGGGTELAARLPIGRAVEGGDA